MINIKNSLIFSAIITATILTISLLSCSVDTKVVLGTHTDEAPKLIVGITIDQMRADYLSRFKDHFSDGGFARVIDGGFSCNDHHFGYAPTFTGPGHASIFTGTTPAIHGIIANDWYVRDLLNTVYCASDAAATGVGVYGIDHESGLYGNVGMMSPVRMISNTIGDELKIATGLNAKVFGVSLKDRGAILPAGHTADGAFWFYGKEKGHFISSTYYFEKLPQWAIDFNLKGEADRLIDTGWDMLLPADEYSTCTPDNNPFEGAFKGELSPVFPYDLRKLTEANGGFDILKGTPGGNTILIDFALAVIDGEDLGSDKYCDLLSVSFSATDYVGHRCGPHAIETMDMYIRLDLELERFFNSLDDKVGEGNWTVFITSDHGAATVPSYGSSVGAPTDYWTAGNMQDRIDNSLDLKFGKQKWISNISNNQIFINKKACNNSEVSISEVGKIISRLVLEEDAILMSITEDDLASRAAVDPIAARLFDGHQPGSSGDVVFVLNPGWLSYGRTGSTHGSPFVYDSHVPCLFYGAGVNNGRTFETTLIRDIAPTISTILQIPYPNGTTGSPISDVIK
tara:strand:+ start:813 stop:2519 length:1707 start_codon:yes stop_codon:yes gene_type:complete